jgi:glycyl-tRNA synthetase beta subunit
VKRLAAEIAREFGCDDSKAVRAAELCKADLTTLMVYEFPELQGVMGRYYAANSGESDDVARAIEEHYLPTSAESSLPTTRLGSVVSIADKLDTIVGYFGIGLTPTGSQDPFSLRRQAIGVCRILLNESCRLSLDATIGSAVAAHGEIVAPDTGGRVRAFFRARLAVIFEERGYAYDDVDAVLSAGFEVLSDIPARLEALRAFRASEEFRRAYPAFNRLLRILPPGDFKSPRQDLMRENAEINLRTVLKLLRVTLDTCVIERDYAGLLRTLSQLQPCIDAFFDDVLVMDNDLEVRENRLALLKSIASYLLKVADFSKLVIAGV